MIRPKKENSSTYQLPYTTMSMSVCLEKKGSKSFNKFKCKVLLGSEQDASTASKEQYI